MKTAKDILWDCVGEDVEFTENIILKAMCIYSEQFIDAANEIIHPALDILPDTYEEEIDKWEGISFIHSKDFNNETKQKAD